MEHELREAKAVNVELTTKIGTLNARIDGLTAKPEDPKLAEARCPDCGGACARRRNLDHFECPGDDCQWRGAGHEVWRRWGDTDGAPGVYWASGMTWATSGAVVLVAPLDRLRVDDWVLGPLPEPKAPGGE